MDRLLAGEWGAALLPEYLFLEIVTVLRAHRDLATAVALGEALLQAREVDLVPCSDVFSDAFVVFRAQRARGFSFADAAIVAVARLRGASFIATFDDDFQGLEGLSVVPAEGAG